MIRVLIEAEAGSQKKNRYDERTLEYKGTGQVSQPYPYPYGFILGTRGADGDSVDCYLIANDKTTAGAIVECEPVGLLEQIEDGEVVHKVLAALPGHAIDLGQGIREELQDFYLFGLCPVPGCPRRGRTLASKGSSLAAYSAISRG